MWGPEFTLWGAAPWDAPLRKIFTPQNEYLTLPNCVQNFNFPALFGDMMGSQIYIRGCCAPYMPPSGKISYPKTVFDTT